MAASTGKKEYTLKINGVTQSVKDVTKLEDALNAVEKAAKSLNTTEAKAATTTKAKAAALTDEEKAAKKLADTQAKIANANSKTNKDQIAANLALRERTREITRQVAASQLEADSIKAMGMNLTDLRNTYEELTAAQRADEDQGGKLLEQIQALDAEYKALRESTGNFRDSVGNYEKGFQGLNELKDKFEIAARGSNNLAAETLGSNEALDAFGSTTEAVAKSSEGLAGVLALATVAQTAYVAVVKEGVIQSTAAAIVDGVRTIQAKAAAAAVALEGEATVGATVAQAAFNLVAAANPYVLLALALVAVIGALVAFVGSTDKSAESQKKSNEIMAATLDQLDQYSAKIKAVYDIQIAQAQAALDLANAQADGSVKGIKRIHDAEDSLARTRAAYNAKQRGFYDEELDDLDKNRAKVDKLLDIVKQLKIAQAKGDSKIKLDINLDGKIDKVKIEDALTSVQGAVDNLNRKINVAVELKADQAAIAAEAAVTAATRKKAAADLAKEQRATQLQDLRALQDDQSKAIKDTYAERRRLIQQANAREIEDLQIRLKTDKTLTAASASSIQKDIIAIRKVTAKQLHDLQVEQNAAELQDARAAIDSETALIQGANEREIAETNIKYDRLTHDLQNRLKNDSTLTVSQQAYLTEQIENAAKAREKDLTAIASAGLQARADTELTTLDQVLSEQREQITKFTEDTTVRGKTGLKLIDVDATRKNLADTNKALADYIVSVNKYVDDLGVAHKAVLSTLKEGTPEYEAEVLKYSAAQTAATKKIVAAQKEQVDNTKQSTDTMRDYYHDLAGKIAEYAQLASDTISGVLATVSMGIQAQLDDTTAQLDIVSAQYDAAQKQREDAVTNVQNLEQQLQSATGGTADALKSQLADSMAARNEAARNEQQLAKQKQKLDDDIAKKQKQLKRNEILSSIASGIANTAEGVTKALTLIFPLDFIVAGLVAASGLAQVGIMTKQLSKLEAGGKIEGARHAQGGVDLAKNYEVEGGEFIVNRQSYGRNSALIDYINANPQGITASEVMGLLPSDTSPVGVNDISQTTDERVLDAIAAIDIRPVVAVTDIISASDNVVAVQDLAGFN